MIHAVNYNVSWYQNAVKSDGGWSLEMIDTKNPCAGAVNWKASVHNSGGTPGRKNSVDGVNTDDQPPSLYRTYTTDSTTIIAVFDEPVDSASAAVAGNHSMNGTIPLAALPATPLFSEVTLRVPASLSPGTLYELRVTNISDCAGNAIANTILLKQVSQHWPIARLSLLMNYYSIQNLTGLIMWSCTIAALISLTVSNCTWLPETLRGN